MNLHVLDYTILVVILAVLMAVALHTRRYAVSVAGFLSANRCAGRYLLTLASGMSGMGAVTILAAWEQYYQAGFAALHWGQMQAPIFVLLALSGWVVYRFCETRAMTLAQFLEIRYSRRFRIFAGTLAWFSGVLNYGIFPAVTGRFLIYFLGLPIYTWSIPGVQLKVNVTLGIVMAVMLSIAVAVTLSGGQIAVMVTDFLQAQFANVIFLLLLVFLLWRFPWSQIVQTLEQAPSGHSMVNPFDQGQLPDFNPIYFLIMAMLSVYNYMVWQGSQGYNSAARSPHEAKMANILAQFRAGVVGLLVPLAAVCAYVFMHNENYSVEAGHVQATLDTIGGGQIARQMTTTLVLTQILPVGFMGLLAAVMIMSAVNTDDTYLWPA